MKMKRTLDEITVNVGEIKYSSKPAIYSCSGIGSCVVLFIYEASTAIGGVAHIMLPGTHASSSATTGSKSLYADTSPGLLIEKLLYCGADPKKLKAKIVGGANLFSFANSNEMARLGVNNIDVVKKALLKHKIYLAAEEVGGNFYKTAKCNTVTGHVLVKMEKEFEKVI